MTQPALTSALTLVIDGRRDAAAAWQSIVKLPDTKLQNGGIGDRLILLIPDSASLPSTSSLPCKTVEIIRLAPHDSTALKQILESVSTPLVGYVPTGAVPSAHLPQCPAQPSNRPFLLLWLPTVVFPLETAAESAIAASTWIISTSLLKQIEHQLQQDCDYALINLVSILEIEEINFNWYIINDSADIELNETVARNSPTPRVLAIVPHYGCEQWLGQCLRSLLNQTHLPNNIVVVDDNSTVLPITTVQQFPTVTLLSASERSGPYRLIQQVIEDTEYEAYLFQDADDWSSGDRLEKLLAAMNVTGCELVGTQELRVLQSAWVPVCYPLDVNRALAEKPGHGLLHPTSLVRRDLVMRLGGFATGLKFGGDTEFLLRAIFVARIVNISDFAYFRRKRPGSLTTDPNTGLDSPARQALIQQCKARAWANYAAVKAGQFPDLTPLSKAEPIRLRHVLGPQLSPAWES